MLQLFSPQTRCTTWRKLWLWLAEAQKELGLDISDDAIDQMRAHLSLTDHDFEVAAVEEKKRRHDGQRKRSLFYTDFILIPGVSDGSCACIWTKRSCCCRHYSLGSYISLCHGQRGLDSDTADIGYAASKASSCD